jgi:hypothetical protein
MDGCAAGAAAALPGVWCCLARGGVEMAVTEERLNDALKDYAPRRVFAQLERRVEKLEQYHCEHEFRDEKKGCLESIFCSKCGALHPDWEEWFFPYFCHEGGPPASSIYIGDKHYRTKASKPKEEEK